MEVPNFPNYIITRDGNVYNQKGHKIKQVLHNTGYYVVCLRNNPVQKNLHIHRLLGLCYIPNPRNYPIIDHIDRNRLNNDLSNLRWFSYVDNSHNTSKYSTNTSGHKNINFRKGRKTWRYVFRYKGKVIYQRNFKSKIDCICYKFICLLRQ